MASPGYSSLLVVGLGDSITAGGALASPSQSWPAQVSLISDGKFSVINDGSDGDYLAASLGLSPEGILPMEDRIVSALAMHPWALVLLGGTNDVDLGTSAVVDELAIATIARDAEADGVRLIVSTVPPADEPGAQGQIEASVRNTLNAWIRAHFDGAHLIDFYKHLAVDGTLPTSEQAIGDGIHPSAAEELWFAQQVDQKLTELSSSST